MTVKEFIENGGNVLELNTENLKSTYNQIEGNAVITKISLGAVHRYSGQLVQITFSGYGFNNEPISYNPSWITIIAQ